MHSDQFKPKSYLKLIKKYVFSEGEQFPLTAFIIIPTHICYIIIGYVTYVSTYLPAHTFTPIAEDSVKLIISHSQGSNTQEKSDNCHVIMFRLA